MKLLQIFNQNYLANLEILNKSFTDELGLHGELQRSIKCIKDDPLCTTIHIEFRDDVSQDTIDKIFAKDITVCTKVKFLERVNIRKIYERMYEPERQVFWLNLQGLCRYSSMLRACGDQLGNMESLALDFMEKNKTCAPEDYHTKLFQEMLSGGSMSQQLMETFKDPTCIKNIINNIGNIMKSPDGSTTDDISSLLDITSLSEEDPNPGHEESQETDVNLLAAALAQLNPPSSTGPGGSHKHPSSDMMAQLLQQAHNNPSMLAHMLQQVSVPSVELPTAQNASVTVDGQVDVEHLSVLAAALAVSTSDTVDVVV